MKKPRKYNIWDVEDPEAVDMSEKDYLKMWQYLVDSGMAWRLQGWYGRTAQFLIENGHIKPPRRKKQ